MKKSGVIRKIDELGRIVIPKEMRKVLNINEYDDIEFGIEDNQIMLTKYSKMLDYKEQANQILSVLNDLIDAEIYVADKDRIVTMGLLEGQTVPPAISQVIIDRKTFDADIDGVYHYALPVIKDSDVIGSIILLSSNKMGVREELLAQTIKKLIENK